MTDMEYFRPGDVVIDTLTITGQRGTVDCRAALRSFSIYEDIFSPSIAAEIILMENHDFTNILPIVGEETVDIRFTTPSRGSATYQFVVLTMEGQFSGENLRTKIYALTCSSKHVLKDRSTVVQKSYNTQISSMVQDLHTTFLGATKGLDIEATQGIQQHIVPNKRPLAAIDALRRLAVSSSSLSSTFLYYENRDTFVFKTLETLMQGTTGDRIYTQQSASNYAHGRLTFNSIISLKVDQQFNSASKLSGGGVSSTVRTWDVNLMKWTSTVVKIAESAFKRADSGSTTSGAFAGEYGTPGKTHTMPVDSNAPPTGLDTTAPQQGAMAAIASGGSASFNIPGDSQLSAGEMCELQIYVKRSETGPAELEPNISGRYLMARVRHTIQDPEVRPRYICAVEALKASYKEGV
jgi:hypothetical protein